MNLEELKEDIAKEEGLKYEIYRCSEGYPIVRMKLDN